MYKFGTQDTEVATFQEAAVLDSRPCVGSEGHGVTVAFGTSLFFFFSAPFRG